jgi:hypothetical protein
MLKKILIAVAAIIAVFLIVVALQPSEFKVERSATISAPPAAVFEQVNDFHKWEAWSPWAKLDPNAKVTFEGPPAGTGTIMTWSGDSQVGEGKMTSPRVSRTSSSRSTLTSSNHSWARVPRNSRSSPKAIKRR